MPNRYYHHWLHHHNHLKTIDCYYYLFIQFIRTSGEFIFWVLLTIGHLLLSSTPYLLSLSTLTLIILVNRLLLVILLVGAISISILIIVVVIQNLYSYLP